ncbi:MAG: potassium transporter TrkG, partial [Verrucomicrobiota bacterium]
MHLSILARFLGLILLLLSAAMLVTFLVAVVEATKGIGNHAMSATGFSFLITGTIGGLFLYLGRGADASKLLRKEAVGIVGLGWLMAALFGSLPFLLYVEGGLNFVESFFESMSGITTTGSTVIRDLNPYPNSILLWRSLTQWIGGLGILALFVALLSMMGISGKSLFGTESSLNLGSSSTSRVRDLTLRLWGVYVGLTILSCLGLFLLGLILKDVDLSFFNALLYSLTVVSTAGFAPHNQSVGHFNSAPIEVFLIFFMIISSFNMVMVINIVSKNFKSPVGKTEAKTFGVILLIGLGIILINFWVTGYARGLSALREALFPVVAVSTTTGFATSNYSAWPMCSQCVLMILMVIGGCGGSTAGGIKVSRVLLALRQVMHEIQHFFRPNQVFSVSLDGQHIDRQAQAQVMAYL